MQKEKALELVERYSRLTRAIADCGRRIGESLDHCRGISGKRGDPFAERRADAKGRDLDLHLTDWYRPDVGGNEWSGPINVYMEITEEEKRAECPHCYAAHLAIRERKELRQKLGAVKGAMTKAVK
jgi:hypothetical protein